MKAQLVCTQLDDKVTLEVTNITKEQAESVDNLMGSLVDFCNQYLNCLESRFDLFERKEFPLSSLVFAQILKSRALLEEAAQQLSLGAAAIKGDVSASELGFPELDDDYFRDAE